MTVYARSFDSPDKTTEFPNGSGRIVGLGGDFVGLTTFRPGWRWSNDVRPIAGTASCEYLHAGYMLTGQLHVETNDGTTLEIKAGQAFVIEPGHDAWVVGDDACTIIDWGTAKGYAERRAASKGAGR